MIEKIEIENFKNFERFEFDGFRRVNLIAGKNNVGKTNLMEAIYLAYNGFGPLNILEFFFNRLQIPPLDNERFFNKLDEKIIWDAFEAIFKTGKDRIFTMLNGVDTVNFQMSNFEVRPRLVDNKLEANFNLLIDLPFDRASPLKAIHCFKKTPENIIQPQFAYYQGYPFNPMQGSNPNEKTSFLHNVSFGVIGLEAEYFKVFEAGRLRNFHHLISLFSNIEVEDSRLHDKYSKGFKSLYLSIKGRGVVPVGEFGFGTQRMLSILLSLFKAENGIAFLDEIDLGIHHSHQELLWEKLFLLSQELNVQLFATTHSRDCFEAFAKVSNKYSGEGKFIRLQEFKGKIEAVEYDEKSMGIASEARFEVR